MDLTGVFEGGGVRGIALAGGAAAAMDQGFRFRQTVGTSAGALVASLVAAGYKSDELGRAVCSTDWAGLLDPVPGYRIPLLGKHMALLRYRGFHQGKALERAWSKLLARKKVRAFGDLKPGSLKIIATDLSHSKGVVFPDDLEHYGIDADRFPIARALRMSAAVPFLFRPVLLRDGRTGEKVLFGDGAMAANFAVGVAPDNLPIVGFVLASDETPHSHVPIRGPASLARSVILAGIHSRYALPRPQDARAQIIQVPVTGDLEFDLTPRKARWVFERGRRAAAEQLVLDRSGDFGGRY